MAEKKAVTTLQKVKAEDLVFEIPTYPDFPQAEWKRRVNRAKELMSENEIDALVLFHNRNVRYFFGFQTICWEMPAFQPAAGIIPVDGEPVIIATDSMIANAQAYCWTREMWVQSKAYRLPEQRAFTRDMAVLLKDLGLGGKTSPWRRAHWEACTSPGP
ncbi:MAG: aminopeptidase P family N-terminal domain-containing protein [Deltaproteobacteria bacterium]|nr:aminopeptidase P family N-terminal domain-containing protein [Deltaproteobacteria bacterium]